MAPRADQESQELKTPRGHKCRRNSARVPFINSFSIDTMDAEEVPDVQKRHPDGSIDCRSGAIAQTVSAACRGMEEAVALSFQPRADGDARPLSAHHWHGIAGRAIHSRRT